MGISVDDKTYDTTQTEGLDLRYEKDVKEWFKRHPIELWVDIQNEYDQLLDDFEFLTGSEGIVRSNVFFAPFKNTPRTQIELQPGDKFFFDESTGKITAFVFEREFVMQLSIAGTLSYKKMRFHPCKVKLDDKRDILHLVGYPDGSVKNETH